MTRLDDNELIERLQAGIAERQSGISAPDGIGDDARRAARRRSATRAVAVGAPVLAAAGVAAVLATGSGAGSTSGRGLGGSAPPISAVSGAPVKVKETAYIVKRVKASLAQADQGSTVVHASGYAGGDVSSDGSLVNLGWKLGDVYVYAAPDGSEYQREVMYQRDGGPYLTMTDHYSPDGNGTVSDAQTVVNPRSDSYSQTRYSGLSDPRAGAATPNLYSSPSKVRQALQSGQVTQTGTATINGKQAIALSIAVPSVPNVPRASLTLYVDAHTYQPLRTTTTYDGLRDLEVADWQPATANNIAQAKDDAIPYGYKKVDKARVTR
jgi:hypothetical protein